MADAPPRSRIVGVAIVTALIFHRNLADQNQLFHFLKNIAVDGRAVPADRLRCWKIQSGCTSSRPLSASPLAAGSDDRAYRPRFSRICTLRPATHSPRPAVESGQAGKELQRIAREYGAHFVSRELRAGLDVATALHGEITAQIGKVRAEQHLPQADLRAQRRVVATWTIETMNGSGLRLVISQPDAALYIQLPIFETTVAIQSTVNVACRKGLQGELRGAADAAARGSLSLFVFMRPPLSILKPLKQFLSSILALGPLAQRNVGHTLQFFAIGSAGSKNGDAVDHAREIAR
jgi:hypothetical protein